MRGRRCRRGGATPRPRRSPPQPLSPPRARRPRRRRRPSRPSREPSSPSAIRAPTSWPSTSTSCAASSSSSGRWSSRGRAASVGARRRRSPRRERRPAVPRRDRRARGAPARRALPSEPGTTTSCAATCFPAGCPRPTELSGLACVPLMVSVEIMAEACSLLAGSTDAAGDRERPRLRLDRPRRRRADPGGACRGRRRRAGALSARRSSTAPSRWSAPTSSSSRLGGSAAWRRSVPARPSVWSGPELYTTGMFHGPVFQSVRQIAGWNETGIDAELFEVGAAGLLRDRRARRGWS